jgi:anti-sigma B factor antagonist
MRTNTRQVEDVAIVDVSGRITVAEGNVMLREVVRQLVEAGHKKIALNLHDVGYVDSSGLGEIVKAYTTVRNQGGELRLVNPSKRVQDLLQMTKLSAVFPIEADEASAIQSFSAAPVSVLRPALTRTQLAVFDFHATTSRRRTLSPLNASLIR